VVVLSHDLFNERSGTVIAMALTTRPQRAGYPFAYRLPQTASGREAWVKISQVRTLDVDRLGGYLGRIDERTLREIVDGLAQIIA
jgi:mRNA interferase MazF